MLIPARLLRVGAFALLTAAISTLPATANASDLRETGTPLSYRVEFDDPNTIACPLLDESTFVDSWGASRSGGRRHQGVDMIAPRSTPIVAAQSGAAEFKQSRLGGNAVWLRTADGNKFYYAHLDGFEGVSRSVRRGEIIGYVGSTGNAGGPHLHFETHFDGSAGNPYQPTFNACLQQTIDALNALGAITRGDDIKPVPGDSELCARCSTRHR